MKSTLILIILFSTLLYADDEDKKPNLQQGLRLFEEWVAAKMAYEKISGMSVGMVIDQKLVWSKGFGFKNLENRTPATADTIYGICSISKLFTAISVMQQRDAGKLRLNDLITQYLSYAHLDQTSKDSPDVTIESLLTHSSGLPRESNHPYWSDPDFKFPTKEEIIIGLAEQKMLYPTDRYFQYSNLGLTFAGEIVEQVSGKSYEDYVQDEILKPLKLTHTNPYLPKDQQGKELATGYSALKRDGTRDVMPFYEANGIAPAAGFSSNVEDLAAFASWQFRLLSNGGTEVLKSTTLREMQHVHWVDPDWKTTWGLGFVIDREDNKTYVGHGGACPGYYTSLVMLPDKKQAAITLVNAMNIRTAGIGTQLLKIVGATQGLKETKKYKSDFEKFTGHYWNSWGESVIVPWKDGLASIDLPTSDPLEDLTELKHIKDNIFRRIRKDGSDLGEEIRFETGPDGKVTKVWWHQNMAVKMAE
jgi:CubicO group peptidase (beta-lactamase class C family)